MGYHKWLVHYILLGGRNEALQIHIYKPPLKVHANIHAKQHCIMFLSHMSFNEHMVTSPLLYNPSNPMRK